MVRRTNKDAREAVGVRIENEGSNIGTDFFKRASPFNENPTKGFHKFMNDHDMDFMNGKLRRAKNGKQ